MSDAERRRRSADLLRTTTLFAAGEGRLQFDRPDVADYLHAHYVVRRYPRARSLRVRKYLAPQAMWPWPDAGMQQILAALWWRSARPVVEQRIRTLLHERNRDPNIRFVIELSRRDLLADGGVREQVLEVLREALAKSDAWKATVGWLFELDGGQALTELESMVRNPGQGTTDRRRLAAVGEITSRDKLRGAKSLAILAGNLTGEPRDRFDTANLILAHDRAQGIRALGLLAASRDMEDLRADAVILIGAPELMQEFIAAGYGLPDRKRAEILAALLALPGSDWAAAARKFAATAAEVGTAVRIADLVRGRDPAAGSRILEDLLDRRDLVDGQAGYRAAVMIGEIEPALAIPALERFAALPLVSPSLRVAAGTRIVATHGGSTATLVGLAENRELEAVYRGDAARAVGGVDKPLAARLFISIATNGSSSQVARLNWLREAYKCDAAMTTSVLAELAEDRQVPGKVRLEAVRVALPTLRRDRIFALYRSMVENSDDQTAMEAARNVAERDVPSGRRLFLKVAERPKAPIELRITAAIEAGADGVSVLRRFATTAHPVNARLRAAKALLPHDRSGGKAALQAIVRGAEGRIRILAAQALPGNSSVAEALVYVSTHDRNHTVRLEAADIAMDHDRRLARPAMQRLVDDPRTPGKIREQARRRLG